VESRRNRRADRRRIEAREPIQQLLRLLQRRVGRTVDVLCHIPAGKGRLLRSSLTGRSRLYILFPNAHPIRLQIFTPLGTIQGQEQLFSGELWGQPHAQFLSLIISSAHGWRRYHLASKPLFFKHFGSRSQS
jgi:hypothetical protein